MRKRKGGSCFVRGFHFFFCLIFIRPFAGHDTGGMWNYTYISETPSAVRVAIRKARSLGMKVMLKPHIDLTHDNNGNLWRGNIMGGPEWMKSYQTMMLMWARVCELEKCEMISIACELMSATNNEALWRNLISEIRAVYHGKLTLSANWAYPGGGGELTNIQFWDALDYIGCDEYFQIRLAPNGTVEDLVRQW